MSTAETTTVCEICGENGGVIKCYLVGELNEREAWAHPECLDAVCGGVIEPNHVGEYNQFEG